MRVHCVSAVPWPARPPQIRGTVRIGVALMTRSLIVVALAVLVLAVRRLAFAQKSHGPIPGVHLPLDSELVPLLAYKAGLAEIFFIFGLLLSVWEISP